MDPIHLTSEIVAASPMRGLTVDVYRAASGTDCTLGGISSRFNTLTVIGVAQWRSTGQFGRLELVCEPMPRYSQVREADPNSSPAALLYRRELGERSLWSIVPAPDGDMFTADMPAHVSRVMMGGNFAHTSDSRLSEITGMYGAIAIHDRIEHQR